VVGRTNGKEFCMGFRRRTRRRALLVGGIAGGAMARRRAGSSEEQEQAPAEDYQAQAQAAPPAADAADEIEHLAQLHSSGALTDEEFSAAKAKILGS
jgi:membrane protease subunit (stomatin/prohibitin family)